MRELSKSVSVEINGEKKRLWFRPRIIVQCMIVNEGDKNPFDTASPYHYFCTAYGGSVLNPLDSFNAVTGCLEAVRDASLQLPNRSFLKEAAPAVRTWAKAVDSCWRAMLRQQLKTKDEVVAELSNAILGLDDDNPGYWRVR